MANRVTLLALAEGAAGEILAVTGDDWVTQRMQSLGLFVGRTVRLLRAGPFSGPLLIEEQRSGARLMIARALAAHIEVWHGPRGG
jgi:Fe2+ transport system protein FeoA